MTYQKHRLSNGIRIIHRYTDSYVAHCGLMINAGSRDEQPEEQGLAHFIEHVIFKGTEKRKAYHILSHMENVGGEINAFTSKEETCIYGSFMHPYYQRWFDLVADIIFRSVFPEKELKKEKDIVIDEINSYKDNPSEQIVDDFDEIIFNGHPLGNNILGTPGHLKHFDGDMVRRYIRRNYVTEEMVICSVGRIDFSRLVHMAEKYFGDIPASTRKTARQKVTGYHPGQKEIKRHNHQAHCMIGNQAYSMSHPRRTVMLLLNNILGGPGMNCRLNMSVREKHGFCYHIESMYQPYSDAGIFGIYFGTDPGYVHKTVKLVNKELSRLRDQKMGSLQLKRAKNQITGQVAIAYESNLSEMLSAGKSMLHLNTIYSREEIGRIIEMITAAELMETANELLDPECMSMLAFKPA